MDDLDKSITIDTKLKNENDLNESNISYNKIIINEKQNQIPVGLKSNSNQESKVLRNEESKKQEEATKIKLDLNNFDIERAENGLNRKLDQKDDDMDPSNSLNIKKKKTDSIMEIDASDSPNNQKNISQVLQNKSKDQIMQISQGKEDQKETDQSISIKTKKKTDSIMDLNQSSSSHKGKNNLENHSVDKSHNLQSNHLGNEMVEKFNHQGDLEDHSIFIDTKIKKIDNVVELNETYSNSSYNKIIIGEKREKSEKEKVMSEVKQDKNKTATNIDILNEAVTFKNQDIENIEKNEIYFNYITNPHPPGNLKKAEVIPFENFKDMNLVYLTPLFDILKGSLEDRSHIQDVILLGIKNLNIEDLWNKSFFDNLVLQDEKYKELLHCSNFLRGKTVGKIGITYDSFENIVYFVYPKGNFEFMNYDEFFMTHKEKNKFTLLLKLQIFGQMIELMKILNQKNFEIGVLHPGLIIKFEDGHIGYLDLFLHDIFKEIDYHKNFHLCNYMGNYNMTNLLNEDITYRYIVMSSVFLAFLMSDKLDIKSTYDKLISELQQDFIMDNANFLNFNKIKDIETKKFVDKFLGSQNTKLSDYLNKFKDTVFNFKMAPETCNECEKSQDAQKSDPTNVDMSEDIRIKFVCHLCLEIICKKCQKNHVCKTEQTIPSEKEPSQSWTELQMSIKKLASYQGSILKLEEKVYSKNFQHLIEESLNETTTQHSRIKTRLQIDQNKLNSILIYLDEILKEKFETELKILEEELHNLIDQIEMISSKIENANREDILLRRKSNVEQTLNFQIREKIEDFNKKLEEFENFINKTKELKADINFESKINLILEAFKFESTNLITQLEKECDNEFFSKNDPLEAEIKSLIKDMDNIPKSDLIYESSYLSDVNNYFAGIVKKENVDNIFISGNLNSKSKTDEKPSYFEIDFSGHNLGINEILPFSTYLNFKTRLVVTGGLIAKQAQKVAFYINFIDDSEKYRKPIRMQEMLEGHDSHAMVKVGDFSLMCIGGTDTKVCEYYDFLEERWMSKAPLNTKRYNSVAFLHNDNFLYVFFGLTLENGTKPRFVEDIEKLDLSSNTSQWEIINIQRDPPSLPKVISFGIIPHKDNMLLIGGEEEATGKSTNGVVKFNVDEMKLTYIQSIGKSIEENSFTMKTNFCLFNSATYDGKFWICVNKNHKLPMIKYNNFIKIP